jgi:tRNA nucleotidyltransferase/poly(A) polymerase
MQEKTLKIFSPYVKLILQLKIRANRNVSRKNFEYVEQKIKEVEEKDHVRNFQPPISGEEIMEMFSLKPGKEIGILKEKVKEAILEGEIPNEKEAARSFVIEQASLIGVEIKSKQIKRFRNLKRFIL